MSKFTTVLSQVSSFGCFDFKWHNSIFAPIVQQFQVFIVAADHALFTPPPVIFIILIISCSNNIQVNALFSKLLSENIIDPSGVKFRGNDHGRINFVFHAKFQYCFSFLSIISSDPRPLGSSCAIAVVVMCPSFAEPTTAARRSP